MQKNLKEKSTERQEELHRGRRPQPPDGRGLLREGFRGTPELNSSPRGWPKGGVKTTVATNLWFLHSGGDKPWAESPKEPPQL